jgi:hypothetical protein
MVKGAFYPEVGLITSKLLFFRIKSSGVGPQLSDLLINSKETSYLSVKVLAWGRMPNLSNMGCPYATMGELMPIYRIRMKFTGISYLIS